MISNQSDESFDVTIQFEFAKLDPHAQRYVCSVCDVDNMSKAEHDKHKKLKQHKRRAKECAILYGNKIRRFADLICRPWADKIAKFGDIRDSRKRGEIQAALFCYTIENDDNAHQAAMETAMKVLQSYNHKERLVALALAVWKTQCILDTPENLNYLSAMEWARWGWKASKVDQQDSSAMDTIVMAVQPFLSLDDDA